MSDRHAAKKHEVVRGLQKRCHRLGAGGPRFLCAGVEARFLRQQHKRLQEHAQIRPLRLAHGFVDETEEGSRSAKELKVARKVLKTAGFVLSRNAQQAVHIFPHFETAVPIR